MKINRLNYLTLFCQTTICLLAILGGTQAHAESDANLNTAAIAVPSPHQPFVQVPAMNITGLAQYRNSYISIIFATKGFTGLALSLEQWQLRNIYEQRTTKIDSDSIRTNAEQVFWQGLNRPNVMIVVIHSQPEFNWINSGTNPNPSIGTDVTTGNPIDAYIKVTINNSYHVAVTAVHLQGLANFQGLFTFDINTHQHSGGTPTTSSSFFNVIVE